MTSADRRLLGRLASTFVAPPETPARGESISSEGACAAEVASAPPAIAILCRPADAWVAGGAVALAGRGPAVVVAWGEGIRMPAARAPATPAARRLAATLAGRGHAAAATGRVVHVLAGDVAEVARIAAAADSIRCVTVAAGPRDDALDTVLRDHDRVLVDADDSVADLALTSLAQADIPARLLTTTTAPPTARALAAAGVAVVRALRAVVEEALR